MMGLPTISMHSLALNGGHFKGLWAAFQMGTTSNSVVKRFDLVEHPKCANEQCEFKTLLYFFKDLFILDFNNHGR